MKTARIDFKKDTKLEKKKALYKILVKYNIHDGNKVKDSTWHLKFESEYSRNLICMLMMKNSNNVFQITYTN